MTVKIAWETSAETWLLVQTVNHVFLKTKKMYMFVFQALDVHNCTIYTMYMYHKLEQNSFEKLYYKLKHWQTWTLANSIGKKTHTCKGQLQCKKTCKVSECVDHKLKSLMKEWTQGILAEKLSTPVLLFLYNINLCKYRVIYARPRHLV